MCTPTQQKLCCDNDCKTCYERSFASHPRSKFWSKKNDDKPRYVFLKSCKKAWFDCDVCHHEFEIRIAHASDSNSWCPYCGKHKLCEREDCQWCFQNSFASHPKSQFWSPYNLFKPRQVFKNSHRKYQFLCPVCSHTFTDTLSHIASDKRWCQYCSNSRLCSDIFCEPCYDKSFESHERSEYWDFERNPVTPRDVFRGDNCKYWFICEKKHGFFTSLNSITYAKTWCPVCKHKTQQKLWEWLKMTYPQYTILQEVTFSWSTFPETKKKGCYDFYIRELGTLIELDGRQHFEKVGNWEDPEKVQERDNFKTSQALKYGKRLVRLLQDEVLNDTREWHSDLKEAIDRKEQQLVCIGDVYSK